MAEMKMKRVRLRLIRHSMSEKPVASFRAVPGRVVSGQFVDSEPGFEFLTVPLEAGSYKKAKAGLIIAFSIE